MSGESSSTEIHTTTTHPFPVSPLSLDFGESSSEYICPVSPLQMYILLLLLLLRIYLFEYTSISYSSVLGV
jgi:hypothetical protein